MSSTINATTVGVGGVVTTADNSGILVLQTASTNAVTISAAQGVTLASTLGVTGATTLSTTLGVTGATTLSSTLGVTGATTLSSTLGVTGAATLSSTLGVTGATTLSSTLDVTGGTFNAITISGSSTNSKGMRFQNSAASSKNYNIGSSGGGPSPAGSFFIYDDTAGATRMVIDTSGNVLIGTTSSSGPYKLETSTDAYINGLTVGRGTGNIISNSVFGNNAGASITTGVYNTCIGYGAGGASATSVQGATYIGAAMQASSAAANYEIAIGFNLVGKGSATFYAGTNGGGSYNGANTTTWATTSDQRLKKNIVDNKKGLDLINQVQVRNFEYRLPEEVTELPKHSVIDVKGIQLGVIAQEIQKILPECVKEETTGVLSVQTDNLIWYLVNSIQELKAIIDTQATRITALETA